MSDTQDYIEEYLDAPDEIPIGGLEDDVTAGGGSPSLALPEQAGRAEIIASIAQAIRQEIDRERRFFADLDSKAVRVTSNLSGEVTFGRYALTTAGPQQIMREKLLRGDAVITCYSGTAYIGKHAGILVGGTDTVSVPVGTSRTIRTRLALWAIGDGVIDVQEEYD